MRKVRLAVRRRRVGNSQPMVTGPHDGSITFTAYKRRNRNSINVDSEADVAAEICRSPNCESTVSHQFASWIIVTATSRNRRRDDQIYRREKENAEFACRA